MLRQEARLSLARLDAAESSRGAYTSEPAADGAAGGGESQEAH